MPTQSTSMTIEDEARSLLLERDSQIAALQKQVTALQNQMQSIQSQPYQQALMGGMQPQMQQAKRTGKNRLSVHATTIQESTVGKGKSKRRQIKVGRERLGRNASISTQNALKFLQQQSSNSSINGLLLNDDPHSSSSRNNPHNIHAIAQRIMDMFKDPVSHIDYLNSEQFAKDLLKLCHKVKHIFENEPRVAFIQSPAYVFGDIHGNLEDLHFFSDNIWRLGMSLTAGNFVFLGDYVDRGMSCLEVVSYLLSMKMLLPHKVFLLRGNHETRDVNGWEEHYGERSFMYQCRARFGDDLGYRLWEQCNQVFDRMPLAAVIDQDIFCVHGGIPRPINAPPTAVANGVGNNSNTGGVVLPQQQSRIQDILHVPRVAGINPPYEHEEEVYQQVGSDCIWSDPASEEQELTSVNQETGFGESLRGGGAICFGHKAVTNFLNQQGLSYIMRAHEAHAEGVAVSKGARVFTVFSTSKDHNQGSQAMAGCILVDFDKLNVINRSPAYKNQYIHRRDSKSIASLDESEIQRRMRIGLVTNSEPRSDDDDDEEWDEFEDDADDEDDSEDDDDGPSYTFDQGRRSSVDITHTHASPLPSSSSGGGGSSGIGDSRMSLAETGSSALQIDFSDSSRSSNGGVKRFPSISEEINGEGDDDQDEEIETVDGEEEADKMDESWYEEENK